VHRSEVADQLPQPIEEVSAAVDFDAHHLGDLAEQDVACQPADESDQDRFGQEIG
jgi:hypothetical protein